MLITAVHIDDNEVTNDSVIRTLRIIFNIQQNNWIYDRTVVASQSLQYDFYRM